MAGLTLYFVCLLLYFLIEIKSKSIDMKADRYGRRTILVKMLRKGLVYIVDFIDNVLY